MSFFYVACHASLLKKRRKKRDLLCEPVVEGAAKDIVQEKPQSPLHLILLQGCSSATASSSRRTRPAGQERVDTCPGGEFQSQGQEPRVPGLLTILAHREYIDQRSQHKEIFTKSSQTSHNSNQVPGLSHHIGGQHLAQQELGHIRALGGQLAARGALLHSTQLQSRGSCPGSSPMALLDGLFGFCQIGQGRGVDIAFCVNRIHDHPLVRQTKQTQTSSHPITRQKKITFVLGKYPKKTYATTTTVVQQFGSRVTAAVVEEDDGGGVTVQTYLNASKAVMTRHLYC